MAENIIEVRDLRRRYGGADGFEAVAGISFDVQRGEMFALLGTNGAGKTSALEVIEGLASPSGGSVRLLGRDPYEDRAVVRPQTGIMLQEGGFPPDLTVRETGEMWAGMASRPRPVAEALEIVELSHRTDVKVRALSGGERRRLDLALAVMNRPAVLFLDEPTTGLDPQSRRRTWQLFRQLLDDGTTILLTTHYLEEADELADRIAIMDSGRIVTVGTAAQIAAAHPARISFQLPDHALGQTLPDLGGPVHEAGSTVTVETEELQRTLTALLAWANAREIDLLALDARSGSLEQAFLAIASGQSRQEVSA